MATQKFYAITHVIILFTCGMNKSLFTLIAQLAEMTDVSKTICQSRENILTLVILQKPDFFAF